MNIGNWSSTLTSPNVSPPSRRSLEISVTGSPLVQRQQSPMYGRTILQSPEPVLNMEQNQLIEIQIRIGTPSNLMLNVEGWNLSRAIFTLDVISPCAESNQTIFNRLLWNEKFSAFGERLELESLNEPGKKQLWKHSQKILGLNSGTGIEAMKTLSLMNSVEELTSHIYSDGSIDIQLSLKSKDQVLCLRRKLFG